MAPSRSVARAVLAGLLAGASLIGAGACGSDGSDVEDTGPEAQATERLRDLGLTAAEARCVADELGAATVVEATDLNALTESQPYREAAESCIDGG